MYADRSFLVFGSIYLPFLVGTTLIKLIIKRMIGDNIC